MNSNINIEIPRAYNRDLYLQIFNRLHNGEHIGNYQQDNEYYTYNMNVFIEDIRQLGLNLNTREEYNRIIGSIQSSRGQSLLKTRVLREILHMDEQYRSLPPPRINGGKRRSKNKLRKSRKIKI
jgi:hypothetical protein